MKSNLFVTTLVFFLCFIPLSATPSPTITAEGAILIEPKTNTILFEKNAFNSFYPASTTKILTSLILLEEMNPKQVITKTKNAVNTVPSDSSHINISVNDTFTAADGLYGIMLGSDNFIAHDMAVKHAGSIKNFSQKMNARAKELGALQSQFVNPHGYHDPNHYTTPYDLSQIAKGAFNNEKLTQIAGSISYPFKVINKNQTLWLKHSSSLLKEEKPYYNPHVVACKTGFHDDAKQTIVAKAVYDNIELIAVVMKTTSPNQYKDINALFEYGEKNFSTSKLDDSQYLLENHTYGTWAKDYVQHALDQNWLTKVPMNYSDKISSTAFIEILTNLLSSHELKTSDFTSFAFNSPLTRRQVSEMLFILYTSLNPEYFVEMQNPFIPDITNLPLATQEAISFSVGTGLLGQEGQNFSPSKTLSYEEALCIAFRFEQLLINTFS